MSAEEPLGRSAADYEFLSPSNTNLSTFDVKELLSGLGGPCSAADAKPSKFAIPPDNDGHLRCIFNYCSDVFRIGSEHIQSNAGVVSLPKEVEAHFLAHAAAGTGGSILYWNIRRLRTKRMYVVPRALKRKRAAPAGLARAPSAPASAAAAASAASHRSRSVPTARITPKSRRPVRTPSRSPSRKAALGPGSLPKHIDVHASKIAGALEIVKQHPDTLTFTARQIPFLSTADEVLLFAAIKTRAGKYYCLHPGCAASISPNNLKKHMGVHRRDEAELAIRRVSSSSADVAPPPPKRQRKLKSKARAKAKAAAAAAAAAATLPPPPPPPRVAHPPPPVSMELSGSDRNLKTSYACPASTCPVVSLSRPSFLAHMQAHHPSGPTAAQALNTLSRGLSRSPSPDPVVPVASAAPVAAAVAAAAALVPSSSSTSTTSAPARLASTPISASAESGTGPKKVPPPLVLMAKPKAIESMPLPTPSSPLTVSRATSPACDEDIDPDGVTGMVGVTPTTVASRLAKANNAPAGKSSSGSPLSLPPLASRAQ